MKKFQMICVAPYEGMREIFGTLTALRSDVSCIILQGDQEEGVKIAAKYMSDDVDAIISRGETANLLEKAFSAPVFHITFSSYDILRSIKAAQNISDRVILIGTADITKSAHLLCDLLQYSSIRIETIGNIRETESILQQAKDQGYSLVIGDMNTVNYAQRLNMQHILIMSGIESIEEALDRAVYVTESINAYVEQLAIMQRAALYFPCEFVVMSDTGKVMYSSLSSESAEKFLSLMSQQLPSLYQTEAMELAKTRDGICYKIKGQLFSIRQQRYALFQVSRRPETAFSSAIKFYNKNDFNPPMYSLPWGHGQRITEFIDTVDQYGSLPHPMLLVSEYGSETDQLVVHIYQSNARYNAPLVSVNCANITQKEWESLFENDSSPLYTKTSILYFQNIEMLTDEQIHTLFSCLDSSNVHLRSKLLMSFQQSAPDSFEKFHKQYLPHLIPVVILKIPPLREHSEDIWEISNLYINELNLEYGKQVIGLQLNAAEQLEKFSWPQNIAQLKQVLTAAVIATNSSYISSNDLNFIMNSTIPSEDLTGRTDCVSIDFALTLREIEREVVQHVLRLEGMNQTRAAKRLNISRSTLWRLMNE